MAAAASREAPLVVAVISDTHRPGRGRMLPEACLDRLRGADLIVHAGDWSDLATVGMVRAMGPPVVAVHGNVEEPAVRKLDPEGISFFNVNTLKDYESLRSLTADGGR